MKLRFTICCAALTALAACTGNNSNVKSSKTLELGSTATGNQSVTQQAEFIARAGEELFTSNPAAFFYADEIFNMALAKDATNLRAQFYKSFIKGLMATRGIYKRVEPIATRNEASKQSFLEARANAEKRTPNDLWAFLNDGTADIKTESDMQKYLAELTSNYEALRLFHKNNQDKELVLNAPQSFALGMLSKSDDESEFMDNVCAVVQKIDSDTYELKECRKEEIVQVKMTKGDHIGIQNMAAGMQIYLTLLNHRNLNGTMTVKENSALQGATSKAVYNELAKNADFGKIRDAKAMANILTMGLDGIAGVRYAISAYSTLCPANPSQDSLNQTLTETKRRRPGYVFSDGICIEEKNEEGELVEDVLKSVELALSGGTIDIRQKNKLTGDEEVYKARPSALFSTPVADLKELKPKFSCGDKIISGISDDTFGGYFPEGGVNRALMISATQECAELELYKGNVYY